MLTEDQERLVFRAAGQRVAATVRCSPPAQPVTAILADAAKTPVYGAFVSLKRAGQLRSCCGFLGQNVPLAEALDQAAVRAAKDDPRFPPISPVELEHLDMEVWLLWGLQPVTARGRDRVEAITIGKHGLQIARGHARGLLLPGVATDHHLDAKAFLQQVCLKAGLPPDAWLHDDTTLMTFEGHPIRGKLRDSGLLEEATWSGYGPSPAEVAALAQFCRGNLETLLSGGTPSYYLPGVFDGGIYGLAITLTLPGGEQKVELSTTSLRSDMPLQSTLFNLAEAAVNVLRSNRVRPDSLRSIPLGLTVLTDPALLGTVAKPELQGFDPRRRAVLVTCPTATAWGYDPERTAMELLQEVIAAAELEDAAQGRVYSMGVVSTEPRATVVQASRQRKGPEVRPAAVAGMFYPGTVHDINRDLDELFSKPVPPPEPWAAALVPHAGWVYSGRLAATVLRRIQVPEQVIMLCPKHRPGGAEWALAPHARWAFPNGELASDPDLARRLADGIEGLELDAMAHAQEHAIEVQLPILARVAPEARVVGIAIGHGDLAALQRFGHELAAVLRELPSRPLLIVSSDMNHFADDMRTRSLDRMALDAIEAMDPARLFETVQRNHISMCGMRPAVIVMEALRQLDSLHRCEVVGYTTSAEASRDVTRVVGYAGVLMG
jgi:AmmeMemoRadiSam system protein B/AmmeMemoRadiSam system protein A